MLQPGHARFKYMKRELSNRMGTAWPAWVGGLIALGSACGDTAQSGGVRDSNDPDGLICFKCARAGGETSDFGGSDVNVAGGGVGVVVVRPSACQVSEQASEIDEAAARALGFGEAIDELTTSFDLPLDWTALELADGQPASGYAPSARLIGRMHAGRLQHLQPTLAGCEQRLRVSVETTLETSDGALSITGKLGSTLTRIEASDGSLSIIGAHDGNWFEERTIVRHVQGTLDLADARGTLQIFPPSSPPSLLGRLGVHLFVWPGSVRASLSLGTFEPMPHASDGELGQFRPFGIYYEPLAGRAPLDVCDMSAQPLTPEAPTLFPSGASTADLVAELRERIEQNLPLPATWLSGELTSVTLQLGQPFDICDSRADSAPGVFYKLPLSVQSGDGRVDLHGDARSWFELGVGYSKGGASIAPSEGVAAQRFAAETGIMGIDFGEVDSAFWRAGFSFDAQASPPLRGDVSVDRSSAGTVEDQLERLSW
jgi:hypothetical protein